MADVLGKARKKGLYCTYHSCFMDRAMIEKHGCFSKPKKCRYMVTLERKRKRDGAGNVPHSAQKASP